jgi:hypothetical protein
MEEKQVNETIMELVKSFQETNQAMAASIVAAQERNLKLVQGVYQHAMEALQGQTESTRTLLEELGQQARGQQERFQRVTSQEAFQKAVKETMDTYMNFLRAPLTYYQQALEAAEAATRQGLEQFQRTSKSFQQATQQGVEASQQGKETAATTMQHVLEEARAQDQFPPPEVF